MRREAVRRALEVGILLLALLLLGRVLVVEPYGVPTGSMAPTLLGRHKAAACPRCGAPVRLGAAAADRDPAPVCFNCGLASLSLDGLPATRGDLVLVNKTAYDFRRPRRWEAAVFRHPAEPARTFVKRVVGLPGELIQIREGDLFVDRELSRKSLAEAQALHIPVFDLSYVPQPDGWDVRWQAEPPGGPGAVDGPRLRLPAESSVDTYSWLVYRHTYGVTDKERPVCDESAYNGLEPARTPLPVHDFLLECDAEVHAGDGWLAFALDDGGTVMVAELPVGLVKDGARLSERTRASETLFRTAPQCVLERNKKYHIVLAFVDRRASLTLDGRAVFAPLDRPALDVRSEVTRPLRIGARGVDATLSAVRLTRDVHYTEAGPHLTATMATRLGAGNYFVLGDNAANSDDSRFWSDADGRPLPVPEDHFLGRPFFVHLPARTDAEGRSRLDPSRLRWLR